MALKTALANLMREKNPTKFQSLVRSKQIEPYLDEVVSAVMEPVKEIDQNRNPNEYQATMEIARAQAETEIVSDLTGTEADVQPT